MPHLTRQQEKAMFAKKNQGVTRSNTNPTIKGRIAGIKEKLRVRRERKGQERIEAEKLALEKEKITAKRLRAELEVEQAREAVAEQRRETQAEFRKIETAKRERKLAPIRKGIGRVVQAGKAVGRATEKATRPKPTKRRKRKETSESAGFFEI